MTKTLPLVFICLVSYSYGSSTTKGTKLIAHVESNDTIKVNQSTIVLTDISATDYLALKKHLNQESLVQVNKSIKRSKEQLLINLVNGKNLLFKDILASTDNTAQKIYIYWLF